ncbi:NADP-dependent oxidoreductase [Mycolicibacterium sp. CBM1]
MVSRPVGIPSADCWSVSEEPVRSPADAEVVVETLFLSIDPGMRNWISAGGSYIDPVPLGAVMPAFGVGRILASASARMPAGTIVTGRLGVQQYSTVDGGELTALADTSAPLPRYLGALGISGMTAYFGMTDVAAIVAGLTVVVSGAAGSVGSIAGQIAKILGCRVIGIAGGARKCQWLIDELGFDAAIDYKSQDVAEALDEVAPEGIDIFFDNVGGTQLDTALARLRLNARVILCGTVSQYNAEDWEGLRNHRALLVKRARMEGFLIFDYVHRYSEAQQQIAAWLHAGELIAVEDIVDGGVAEFPSALAGLFDGANLGKRVLRVGGTG